jgi:hypothetical protein
MMGQSTGFMMWLLLVLTAGAPPALAQDAGQPTFKKEEIEQLVAPIALYPDALIAQVLMASTYPLEIVEAARWVKANPNVKGSALEEALQKQKWDPAVKSLAAFPQVLAMMNEKLDITQKLGDAFLAQQKDVMEAVQRLRTKAQAAGNLKTSKEQTVSSEQQGGTTIIKIEPTNPETVYVPTYNPTAVYGPWPYPAYPPYPYYPPGYVPGAALFTFTAGVIVGNALWGNCNWGGGDVNVNVNKYNNFNKTDIKNSNWQHNSEHRKGAGYRDSASQQKYGKGQRQNTESREAFRGRAEQGRQDIARGDADQFKRDGAAGGRDGAGDRAGGAGQAGDRSRGQASDRAGGAGQAGDRAGGAGQAGDRAGGAGQAGNRASAGDMRNTSYGGGGRQPDAFQGVGSGAETRAQSDRGAASRGGGGSSMSGGGGARAGGGGGGAARGGGGGGRGGGGRR